MKDNFIFVLIVFLFIVTILVYFPNQKNKKLSIQKNEKIIKVEQDAEYAAVITQDMNNKSNNINNLSPAETQEQIKISQFKISNVRFLDTESIVKETFIFNEPIQMVFDYELPKGFYTFRLETIPDIDINLKDDILRQGNGATDENPVVFSVNTTKNLQDVNIKKINILVFKTDDYEVPIYNQVVDTNIIIKNLKINLIREEDFTSPLILSNT